MTNSNTCGGTLVDVQHGADGPTKFACDCLGCTTPIPAILTPLGEQYRQDRIRAQRIADAIVNPADSDAF